MQRFLSLAGCWLATMAFATASIEAQPVPSFGLEIDAPAVVKGNPESTSQFSAQAFLATTGLDDGVDGAQGWSVGVACEDCQIVGATTDGTVGADVAGGGLRNNGFEKTELTESSGTLPDNDGVVSAVVLSFTLGITLPPSGRAHVLNLDVEVQIPTEAEGSGEAHILFKNGLRGSGQPVDNKATYQGNTFLPTLGDTLVALEVEIDCTAEGTPLALLFQSAASGQSEDRLANVIPAQFDLSGRVGERAEGTVFVGLASQLEGPAGVQGWSIAVGGSGVEFAGATTEGTVGAEVANGGLRNTGFEKTETVNPETNNQGQGIVSAVVLSFTLPITLNPVGIATILRADILSEGVVTEAGAEASLSFKDGLTGAGQPVNNVATVGGKTAEYCALAQQVLEIDIVPVQVGSFIAGDANGDARLDIGDPIWIINELFRSGLPSLCRAATDANGDDLIDLSDATHIIQYLFFAGAAPSGSLTCAIDDAVTPEECPFGSSACDA
jgi:hypothetical protein